MGAGNANPMSAAAARRRPDFDSLQAAFDNFASKAPLNQLHRDALRAYVEGGFAPTGDGSVTLRCRPATEAAIFAAAPTSGAWEEALRVAVATRVLSGRTDHGGPALFAEHLANALVDGSLAVHRELGHFGPLEDPDAMSADIAAWITEHGER
jgi:pimeloyl-ACP methyl ester carboxylesterase